MLKTAIACSLCCMVMPGLGRAAPVYAMGVLGDSISAATLADVPLPSQCRTGAFSDQCVQDWVGSQDRLIYTNKRNLSWASGRRIHSHFRMLQEFMVGANPGASLEVLNHARPGATAEELPAQARALVEEVARRGLRGPIYVALTIGSNDACAAAESGSAGDVELGIIRMQAGLLGLFDELSRSAPAARVLVVSPPSIPVLGQERFIHATTVFGLSCGRVRNGILRFCNGLTAWSTRAEESRALAVMARFHRALAESVRSPGHRQIEVVLSTRLLEIAPAFQDLAGDCFHPSALGQERIAESTWNDQPWFH